ncbi:MAG: hypothetical protein RL538_388 [Candidatus Parcubacteria bacterium]|jgi:hypothetical protein
MKNIHVTKHEEGWQAKEAGSKNPMATFSKQSDAINFGTSFAKLNGTELFVHGRNGQIRERNSFGNDPFPPKG